MSNTLLEIKDLNISFNLNNKISKTVSNFNINLKKKKTIGIVGESGSGKTLSMLALTRLLPKQAFVEKGKIIFDQKDITNFSNKDFYKQISGKRISMIFQEPMTALNPVYTVGRQLIETYLFHNYASRNEAYKRSINLLESVQLTNSKERMNQYPHQLSGGQRQRVMIAMSLINDPELLIADEPTTALDVTVQKEIILLIEKLIKDLGMAMIFISHDLGVVSEISEEIIVMKEGLIIENGKTKSVINNPKKEYTNNLLQCLWKLDVNKKNLNKKNEILIKINKISKRYFLPGNIFKPRKTVDAVKNVSFEIFKGETLAIVGESGSGKSTIAKIINGLIPINIGEVLLDKKSIKNYSPKNRAKLMQPVFQDPYSTLNPNQTIGYIISRPLIINTNLTHNDIKNEVYKILNLVDLPESFYNRFPNQLSGGQRQRVAIARAIILKPKILICDEPTSSLDVTIQFQILELLNSLKKRLGMTIILISHDISVVNYLSDRIFVMHNGEIVESGITNKILKKPSKNYTKKLLSAVYKIKRQK
tara:strand:+ start:3643 stop:5247 length:1605 start_codon:yes stop_codon:yes gene_type:complete